MSISKGITIISANISTEIFSFSLKKSPTNILTNELPLVAKIQSSDIDVRLGLRKNRPYAFLAMVPDPITP